MFKEWIFEKPDEKNLVKDIVFLESLEEPARAIALLRCMLTRCIEVRATFVERSDHVIQITESEVFRRIVVEISCRIDSAEK